MSSCKLLSMARCFYQAPPRAPLLTISAAVAMLSWVMTSGIAATMGCGQAQNQSADVRPLYICSVLSCIVCLAVDCGPLDPPVYGEISFIGEGFGAIARYSCIPGYTLVGGASRTCQSDGYWSGRAPTCVRGDATPPSGCGDPGTPANGIKEGTDYSIGSTVYYLCASGYQLVGASSLLCQFNRQWSDGVPRCISDQCKSYYGWG